MPESRTAGKINLDMDCSNAALGVSIGSMPHVDLLELPYFQGISIDAVVSLVDELEPRSFEAGSIIMAEGAPTVPMLYIATAGTVRVSKKNARGENCHLADLEAPTLFGDIELLCEIDPVATYEAMTRISAFQLSQATFAELFHDRHPALLKFTLNVARVTCHRLAIADEMLAEVLDNKDLATLREKVFARTRSPDWLRTTGAFRRPVRSGNG